MKRSMTASALGALALVLAGGLAPPAAGSGNAVVHWAVGSGHQDDVDAATGVVYNRTFAFSAVQYADGTTEGTVQVESRKFDLVIHMRIDCLYVAPDGRTARLSGVITRTSRPFADAPVGEVHRLTVQDNGEPGAGVDMFSGVPANPLHLDCNDVTDTGVPPTRKVNRGEIQVR
jgi:hypothetical protein